MSLERKIKFPFSGICSISRSNSCNSSYNRSWSSSSSSISSDGNSFDDGGGGGISSSRSQKFKQRKTEIIF